MTLYIGKKLEGLNCVLRFPQNFLSLKLKKPWKGLFPCFNEKQTINPLSPKRDKHQFSPNNNNTQSREKVVRISKMITKGKMH